jgi:hypothetical protein
LDPCERGLEPKKGQPVEKNTSEKHSPVHGIFLGQAAGISAEMASSLVAPNPSGYSLIRKRLTVS